MTEQEVEMQALPAGAVVEATGISRRTVHSWLQRGELEGEQTATGRWSTTVKAVRGYLRENAKDKGRTEARFDAWVREHYPTEHADMGVDANRKDVLVLSKG